MVKLKKRVEWVRAALKLRIHTKQPCSTSSLVSSSFWSSESGGQRFMCMYKVQEEEHNNLFFIRILISESISDVPKTYRILRVLHVFSLLCFTCVRVVEHRQR